MSSFPATFASLAQVAKSRHCLEGSGFPGSGHGTMELPQVDACGFGLGACSHGIAGVLVGARKSLTTFCTRDDLWANTQNKTSTFARDLLQLGIERLFQIGAHVILMGMVVVEA